MYGLVRKSGLKTSGTKQRDEVVFADALQYQEGDGGAAAVRHEMRPPRRHAVGLAWHEAHFLLRLLQEDAQRALEARRRYRRRWYGCAREPSARRRAAAR